jgi:predicted  nucleic acid-binding Zn-ribbon protein
MKYVLKAVNKELKDLEIRADEWYDKYHKLYEEYHDLKEENEMLRKDLQELSKEHFKK